MLPLSLDDISKRFRMTPKLFVLVQYGFEVR